MLTTLEARPTTRPPVEAIVPPHPALIRFTRIFGGAWFRLCHSIEYHGVANVPRKGPLLVSSNHPSYLDPCIIGLGLRRDVYWMTWKAAFDWPLVGAALRAYRAFPVDLERPKPSTFRAARAVLARGLALGVFPEGGRSSGPGADPFKPGAARLALSAGATVQPVSIRGGHAAWPRDRALPRPGRKIVVTYHPPIDAASVAPGEPPRLREAELLRILHRTVASGL